MIIRACTRPDPVTIPVVALQTSNPVDIPVCKCSHLVILLLIQYHDYTNNEINRMKVQNLIAMNSIVQYSYFLFNYKHHTINYFKGYYMCWNERAGSEAYDDYPPTKADIDIPIVIYVNVTWFLASYKTTLTLHLHLNLVRIFEFRIKFTYSIIVKLKKQFRVGTKYVCNEN